MLNPKVRTGGILVVLFFILLWLVGVGPDWSKLTGGAPKTATEGVIVSYYPDYNTFGLVLQDGTRRRVRIVGGAPNWGKNEEVLFDESSGPAMYSKTTRGKKALVVVF